MEFVIQIGTSRGWFVRLLIVAGLFVLGGMVLGLADPAGYVPVSGWIPVLIGLAVAAVAAYRRFARPVVMTIDQAGIRVPRQIQLLPWGRIEDVRPTVRFGFARFLVVRAAECKTVPGFATGRRAAGLLAPKVAESEIALNLTGVYLCCKHEGRVMIEKGYGKIINTSSMSGHIVNTPQNQSAYNTSKAGVLHLTKSLAAEWAQKGVRVNSISPGYTRTKLVEEFLETPPGQKALPVWMERTPMGKMLDVTDLQGAVVFLAGPASDFMTGADMLIDGGYCTW